ncbi:VCBS domain-containing protein, partial [Arthrospira platensis SPKY2]
GTRANHGTVAWTFTLANDLVRFLRVDESIVVTYTVTVTDTVDGTDEVDVVVTIQGSNDQPSVSATPPSDFTEAADASAQTLSQSGTVSFGDVDVNDLVTITFASNGA